MSNLYLGIDTSNYKTSIAVVNSEEDILFNRSEYLDVKLGERGLRQSEAFFKHSNALPEFVEDAFRQFNSKDLTAIGVSTRPRRVDGSYMPCFLAGHNLAKELSSALNIPLYEFSHQEGHAAAVISDAPEFYKERSLFFHLSGGTTEFLLCEPDNLGYKMEIVGGTKDISIGQLLDRLGVKMGYQFPSGKYLDDIAISVDWNSVNSATLSDIRQLVAAPKIENCSFNLSGLETKLSRFLDTNHDELSHQLMIGRLFIVITQLLTDCSRELSERYGVNKVLMAGGVAASHTVRTIIDKQDNDLIQFCAPELSGDNAVGIAILSKIRQEG